MIDVSEQTVRTVITTTHDIVASKDEKVDVWQIRVKCSKNPRESLSYVLVTSRNPDTEIIRCVNCRKPLFN
jgi:DNA-directed RNA polymerase subunit M/transcription elongation factor TFIIS